MQLHSFAAGIALLTLLGLSGCKGRSGPPGRGAERMGGGSGGHGGPADAATVGGADGGAAPDDAAPVRPAPVEIEGAARGDLDAFLERWIAAQNAGDFEHYQALYAPAFHGVRRTGKRVRSFDRAGWLQDRGGMFKRPMHVEADHVVAWDAGGRRQLFFTQTWSQGSFRDVGTKDLVVTGRGADVHLVYEELLESRVSPPPVVTIGGAGDAFGLDRATSVDTMRVARVMSEEMHPPGLARNHVVLLATTARDVAWVNARVVESTRDPATGDTGSAVVEGEIPPDDPLAQVVGTEIQVLDEHLQPICSGVLDSLTARYTGKLDGGSSDDATIAAARAAHEMKIYAAVRGLCLGPYIRGLNAVKLAAPPVVTELPDQALASLRSWDPATQEGTMESAMAGATGYVLVTVHTMDACDRQERYQSALVRVTMVAGVPSFASLAQDDGEDSELVLLDANGDGTLDALTAMGDYVSGQWRPWNPETRLFFPAGLGCDGNDESADERDPEGD